MSLLNLPRPNQNPIVIHSSEIVSILLDPDDAGFTIVYDSPIDNDALSEEFYALDDYTDCSDFINVSVDDLDDNTLDSIINLLDSM